MSRNEVMDTFKMLARIQGGYAWLCEQLNNADESDKNDFLDEFKDCKNPLDIVKQIKS